MAPIGRPRRIGRRLFGNPDQTFLQSRPKHGLLTPAEVRAMALAQMDLGPASIVWDIGAGSGSVSIEAAQIADERHRLCDRNGPRRPSTDPHQRRAVRRQELGRRARPRPDAWADLPDPDSVFVGGSGREIARLVELAFGRLRPGGRLVASVGSIENLSAVHEVLSRYVGDVGVWMINIARGVHQLERVRFEALSPTFLLAVVKPK